MKQMLLKVGMVCLTAVPLLLGACGGIIDQGKVQDIDSSLRSMSAFHQPAEMANPQVVGPIDAGDPLYPDRPEDFTGKVTQAYKVTAAPGFDQLLCMDPRSDVMWLGSILDGNSITSGDYRPITTNRGPLTFSINIPMGTQVRTIPVASLSSVREATSQIVTSSVLNGTPGTVSFTKESVYSEHQAQLAIGANFRGWGVSVKAGFDFLNIQKRSRLLVKFQQIYYSLDLDIPQDPSELFASGSTWNDLQYQIGGDVSPVLITSIKFGRLALFTIESDYSETDVKAALDVAYNCIFAGGGVSVDTSTKNVLSSSTIKGFIYGGDSSAATEVAISGFDGFVDWLRADGNLTNSNLPPSAPMSYTMRYLKDWSLARVVLGSEYWMRRVVGEDTIPLQPKYSGLQINSAEIKNEIRYYYISSYIYPNLNVQISLQKGYDDYGLSNSVSVTASQAYTTTPKTQLINSFTTGHL